jgi:hypothetical protein
VANTPAAGKSSPVKRLQSSIVRRSPGEGSLSPASEDMSASRAPHAGPFLTAYPRVLPAGEPLTVAWGLPKMVQPLHAWVGIFESTGPMSSATAVTRHQGHLVRQLSGTLEGVLLPPKVGLYRVAYFASAASTAEPFSPSMVAEVHVVLPRMPKLNDEYAQPPKHAFTRTPSPTPYSDSVVERVVVQPSWVPFDTKRSKSTRMAGTIARAEQQRDRPKSLTPMPTSDGGAKPRVEYVCNATYADETRSRAQYSRNVTTTLHEQERLIGKGNVQYIGAAKPDKYGVGLL